MSPTYRLEILMAVSGNDNDYGVVILMIRWVQFVEQKYPFDLRHYSQVGIFFYKVCTL